MKSCLFLGIILLYTEPVEALGESVGGQEGSLNPKPVQVKPG